MDKRNQLGKPSLDPHAPKHLRQQDFLGGDASSRADLAMVGR